MIDKFEQTRDYHDIIHHFEYAIKIIGFALEKTIIVVDKKGRVVFGDKDTPITSETIVIIVYNKYHSFSGTKLGEYTLATYYPAITFCHHFTNI